MRGATKMLMISSRADKDDMRYPDMGEYRGKEYREGGGYDARKASRGTLTWDNTRGAESAYRDGYGGKNYPRYDDSRMNYPRSEMDEPEARRRRDSRGRFRSEMDGYYPGPNYPPPVYERMNQIGFSAHDGSERNNLHMIRGGSSEHGMKLDEETAHEWMENLHNEDGSKGPHWTKDQTTQVLKQKNLDCDPLEFWVAINAMYSDYFNVAKKANVNNIDFYVNMAKAFLDDKDATPGKLAAYYEYIVK
jgi:hypothetical protein